jgi:OOP family OmpA-OmpF porin
MKQVFLFITLILCTGYVHAQDSIRRNLGPNINTEFDDISAIISPDGKTLYYVISGHPSNTYSSVFSDAEDIWYSELDVNGSWTKSKRMAKPFNLRRYNSIQCISPDGNVVYIRGAYQDGEYIGTGFSYVIKNRAGWSQPQEMNIKNYLSMSKGNYSSMWMCPDGKTLILSFSKFSSRYSEIEKDKINDLYVCFKTGPNQWSKPLYIKTINTKKYTESTPFMATDNTTLYFSSDRPGGKGSRDVWMTKRLDDSWTNWTAPVNLNDNINSSGWDGYYTTDAKGEYGYLVSDKVGYGLSYDIVRIKLAEIDRPNPVVLISGKVINAKTNQPISARITYHSLLTGKEIGQAISDPATGNYKITLPYGVQYSFNANGSNYIPVSNNIDLSTVAQYKEINQDLFLVPIEIGSTVQLNNIFFDVSKATLRPESYIELDKLFVILQGNAGMEIEIDGHTDNVGDAALNIQLSIDRANAVKDYLIKKGVVHTRISTKGFGGNKPVASNDTEETKKLNRRVEFTILKL